METRHDKELERNGKDVKKKGVDIAKRALSRPGLALGTSSWEWKAMESNGKEGMDRNRQEWTRQGEKVTEMDRRGNRKEI